MDKFKKLVLLCGAYLAFQIGSGVATGQEVMQYYTPYGWKMIGSAVIIVIIYSLANYGFAYAGRYGNITKGNDVFTFYCGTKIGMIFDIFTNISCYLSYMVMISGAASTLKQQYGVPLIVGAGIIIILSILTVAYGLNLIVEVIGRIGPLLVLSIFVVVGISLIRNSGNVSAGIEAVNSGTVEVMQVGKSWITSGLSNGGMGILWLASFTGELAKKEDFKRLLKASIMAFVTLVTVNSIIGLAILAQIDRLADTQIPNLVIATQLWAPLGHVFGIFIFAAIYTSACPLLWTSVSRFSDEGTSRFKILTVTFAIVALLIAMYVPYNKLLNGIYVLNGYIGFLILVVMLVKRISIFLHDKKENKELLKQN